MATTLGSARGFRVYDSQREALEGALAQLAELELGNATALDMLTGSSNKHITDASSKGIYRSQCKPVAKSVKDWRRTLWNGSWDTVSWAPRF